MPDGDVVQTVVVVTGTVDGTVVAAALDCAVAGLDVVVVVAWVDAAGTVVVVTAWALVAANPTSAADVAPAPTKTVWVSRRTRAKRRSRCWGVRGWCFTVSFVRPVSATDVSAGQAPPKNFVRVVGSARG